MLRNDGSSEAEGDSDHHASGNGHTIFKEKDIRYVGTLGFRVSL